MSEQEIEQNVQEDSVAMATLHANSRPVGDDPKSKLQHISQMIGAAHAMSSTELEKWFKDAMALIGHEDSHLPAHANEKGNENSLNMKPSHAVGHGGAPTNDPMPRIDHKNNPLAATMKEDVRAMFEGQDLSEEFQQKASTLFEAAVTSRVIMETERLEEEYAMRLEEEVKEIAETIEKQVDSYLDYVVENWMKQNEVAIEATLRNEIAEEFITGLRGLFAEHYINVPQEKMEVIEKLASKVEELELKLDEAITENAELKEFVVESDRQTAIAEMSENMTMTQVEKFNALAEGIDFDGDVETYKKKLSYIKDSFITGAVKRPVSNIEEETFEGDTAPSAPINPEVASFVNAISRTVKK